MADGGLKLELEGVRWAAGQTTDAFAGDLLRDMLDAGWGEACSLEKAAVAVGAKGVEIQALWTSYQLAFETLRRERGRPSLLVR